MGDEERLNFGYAGAGEWAGKIDEFSDDQAYAFKAYDIKPYEEVDLELDNPDNFYQIDEDKMVPPEEFYEDVDVMVLSNLVQNHELQFYDAADHMPEDKLLVYEKALSPRAHSHERILSYEDDEAPDFVPTLHYWQKPAAKMAERVFDGFELDEITGMEIIATEQRLNRPWTLKSSEGGSVVDFGSHALELPVVNFDGYLSHPIAGKAKGWDMNADIDDPKIDGYNEAFEASWNIEGGKFDGKTELRALIGKNFPQDRKEFLINGRDDRFGDWSMHGFYGTDDQQPYLEFWSDEIFQGWDLSDWPDAKNSVISDLMGVAMGSKEPELTPERHAEIMAGLDEVNSEMDLYRKQPEEFDFEEWKDTPELDYDLLKRNSEI
jgi:hypothetical protein